MSDKHDTDNNLSRRAFSAAAVAAGVAGASEAVAAAGVTERDVRVTTPDGTCDAAFFHPAGKGRHPGVIIFPDALGLRPAFRDMGRRLAGEGYTVLVPNPFYRTKAAPVIEGPFDFSNPADRAKLGELRKPLTPEAVTRDGTAFVAFLDAQPATDTRRKIGVQGYCMGGAMTVRTAAANPGRVGAGGSFHGGGLATATPDSPHLLAPRVGAELYIAVAGDDDAKDPAEKERVREAFAAAGRPAKIEVYGEARHGWCVPGSQVYKAADAERAWAELLSLYGRALA